MHSYLTKMGMVFLMPFLEYRATNIIFYNLFVFNKLTVHDVKMENNFIFTFLRGVNSGANDCDVFGNCILIIEVIVLIVMDY